MITSMLIFHLIFSFFLILLLFIYREGTLSFKKKIIFMQKLKMINIYPYKEHQLHLNSLVLKLSNSR